MTDKKQDKNPESIKEKNIFIAELIYPEIQPIFTAKFKSIDEIKKDCLIVIDTNVLLVPYSISKDSLTQLHKTYSKLVSEKRLFIPAQVVREFAKNRTKKLTELYQQFNRKVTDIKANKKDRYPLLESVEDYEKSLELEEKINTLTTEYKRIQKKL